MRATLDRAVPDKLERVNKKRQDVQHGEQERMIVDQRRQILLLPDLQKQAEESRKTSETAYLENEALKKQIVAMEEEQETLRSTAAEAATLAGDLDELKKKVQELQKPWWKKLLGESG